MDSSLLYESVWLLRLWHVLAFASTRGSGRQLRVWFMNISKLSGSRAGFSCALDSESNAGELGKRRTIPRKVDTDTRITSAKAKAGGDADV